MSYKPYTNFKVVDDAITMRQPQQMTKTDHNKIEAIRHQQLQPEKETFPAHVKQMVIDAGQSFNDWSNHIRNLLMNKS